MNIAKNLSLLRVVWQHFITVAVSGVVGPYEVAPPSRNPGYAIEFFKHE